jgi:protein TonB
MFERFEDAKRHKGGGWRLAGLVASIAAHAGIGMGVLVWTFWQIDKVKLKGPIVDLDYSVFTPPPALGVPEAPKDPVVAKKPPKPRLPDELTQAPKPSDQEPSDEPAEPGDSELPQGDPNGVAGGDPNAPPGTGIPGGGGDPNVVVTPPPDEKWDPSVAEARRIAGIRNIGLPPNVLLKMRDSGQRRADALVKLCLDESGAPKSITIAKSTGFDEADQKIKQDMRGWRYRPTMVDGRPIGACTVVQFQYVVE